LTQLGIEWSVLKNFDRHWDSDREAPLYFLSNSLRGNSTYDLGLRSLSYTDFHAKFIEKKRERKRGERQRVAERERERKRERE